MPKRIVQTLPLLVAAALLLTLGPLCRRDARRAAADTRALSNVPGSIQARNTNAFARILGELRMGAADFLFVKTELYLHGGISYHAHVDDLDAVDDDRNGHDHHDHEHDNHDDALADDSPDPLLELETPGDFDLGLGRAPLTGAHDHAAEEALATRIRGKDEDFRGFLGDLEREIKPWRDPDSPHVLTGGAELLPWFRLMTIADPHFVRGYRIGAMWLGRDRHYDQALAYIQEGIDLNAENPELFQLYLSKVLMTLHKARHEETNADADALEAARFGLAAGFRYRPESGEIGAIHRGLLWTDDHEEDIRFLARFVVMLFERERRFDDALAAGREARAIFPDDEIIHRLVQRLESGQSPYRADAPQ
jgi:hypothetical protein